MEVIKICGEGYVLDLSDRYFFQMVICLVESDCVYLFYFRVVRNLGIFLQLIFCMRIDCEIRK